ncbi:cell division protein FtsW [Candidatus Gottesmanbacteria bacterium RBG_16_52_11]|uniref:Probable peptidoglycan glycosyltransferase FtsW n=1 Tax=Candidatus Gottesmanbacteria bacterium RBG_16_52_11 TaxID=1798374 RepID=A0A1F5YUC5_9BACT|nr:MAG: cell division protein FtsW [Candidatus Gottesmanbacteria bacterium RBG_16_52_11]
MHHFDWWLVAVILSLTLFGLLMVYNSSVAIAVRDFGDPGFYLREQLRGFLIGVASFVFFALLDYRRLKRLALPLFLFNLVLLAAVFLPGIGITALGASRWIRVGFFVFQPAELAKLTITLYLATWFTTPEKGRLIPFLVLLSMVVGLVILEPDLGTSIVLTGTATAIFFASGTPLWNTALLIPLYLGGVAVFGLTSPYRLRRIMTFLNSESDPLGASYQIRQALIAVGSGGLFGLGLGKSRQKYEYLPEANTDSIFAILAEEGGFIGAMIVLILLYLLIARGYRTVKHAPDLFGRLLSLGIITWIGIQVTLNIGSMLALVPLTGIPLPLVSYGSSSLVITLSALGILVNISSHAKH